MGPALKYCGITKVDSLIYALKLGVGFVGFNFYQESKRFIDPAAAASIWKAAVEQFPSVSSTPVAVCVDMDNQAVRELLEEFPQIEIIQCHGSESPTRLDEIRELAGDRKIWKAIHVIELNDLVQIKDYFAAADLLLYDTKAIDQGIQVELGGTGQRFDWSLLNRIHSSQHFALAGGIKQGMIEAASATGASIIDLCSGIEESPGVKSEELMKAIYDEAAKS
jgi:phosphoribosylanthranilate isomerase